MTNKKTLLNLAKVIRLDLLKDYVLLAMATGEVHEFATFDVIAKFVEKELPEMRKVAFGELAQKQFGTKS